MYSITAMVPDVLSDSWSYKRESGPRISRPKSSWNGENPVAVCVEFRNAKHIRQVCVHSRLSSDVFLSIVVTVAWNLSNIPLDSGW